VKRRTKRTGGAIGGAWHRGNANVECNTMSTCSRFFFLFSAGLGRFFKLHMFHELCLDDASSCYAHLSANNPSFFDIISLFCDA
jgi:hypothetical protein